MGALSGVKGKVTLPAGVGQTIVISRWTASADRDVFDISSFDSALNERDKLGGMLHLIGTVEGFVDSAAMLLLTQMQTEDLISDAVFLLITRRGAVLNGHYQFNGVVSNTSLDVPKAGVQAWSMAFESTNVIQVQNQSDV